MDDDVEAAVAALFVAQHGLASRSQLRETGLTREALRWRLGRQWRLVLPDVIARFTGQLTRTQRLVAGQLWAGSEAALTGMAGAAWHGLKSADAEASLDFVAAPSKRDRAAAFVIVRRSERPVVHPWRRGSLTIAGRPRVVVDAACLTGVPDTARALLIEAVQRRLTTVDQLAHEVFDHPCRGRAVATMALRDAASGVWSVPEADLLRGLSRSRVLPEVAPNPLLQALDGTPLISPDAYIESVGLAVMVHSRRHHQREDDFDATIESDGLLGEHGVTVVGVTPRGVDRYLDRLVTRVENVYQRLERQGASPPVRVVERHRTAGGST